MSVLNLNLNLNVDVEVGVDVDVEVEVEVDVDVGTPSSWDSVQTHKLRHFNPTSLLMRSRSIWLRKRRYAIEVNLARDAVRYWDAVVLPWDTAGAVVYRGMP